MEKKKRVVLILIILSIILGCSAAMGIEAVPEALNIKSLETQLLSQNPDIRQAKEWVSIADYKLNAAEETKGMVAADPIESRKNQKYYLEEAEMNVDYAQWQLKEKKEEILLKGKETYFSLLLNQKEILLEKAKLERLEKQMADLEKKVSLGLAVESDKTKLQLAIDSEALILQRIENGITALEMDMNLLLNRDMASVVKLTEESISFESYSLNNLGGTIKDALEENGELIRLDGKGDLLLIELNIYDGMNSNDTYNRKIVGVKEDITQNGFDYDDARRKLEYDIRTAYNTLLSAYDSCMLRKMAAENLSIDIAQAEKHLKVGLITEDTLTVLKEQLAFEQLNLEKEKLHYFLSVEAFKNHLK